MEIFALIAGCFALGAVAARAWPRSQKLAPWINHYIIYLSLPAIVLSSVPDISIDRRILFPTLIPWAMLLINLAVTRHLCRRLNWDRDTEACLLLLGTLGNTAFLGLGITSTLLGDEQLASAILFDQLGSFLILSSFGTLVVTLYSSSGQNPKAADFGQLPRSGLASVVLKKILNFPPFLALITALLLPSTAVFGEAFEWLKSIGNTTAPLAMIAVGLQIKFRLLPEHRLPLAYALSLKMLILPAVALVAGWTLGIEFTVFSSSVFQAAMPPMITPAILLMNAGIAPRLTSGILGAGTLLALVSLPLWALILNTLAN